MPLEPYEITNVFGPS